MNLQDIFVPAAFGAALAAGTFSGMALAQSPTIGEDIVVTATRTPTLKTLLGSSVTVITAEEMEKMQSPAVANILRRTPGINIQQNGPTGTSSVAKFRGLEEEQTLVLINGVRQNDPGDIRGRFNFEHLMVSNIERIEIIRGPQATLYGSRANGAVINIITKKGKDDFSGRIKTEAGTGNTRLVDMFGGGGGRLPNGMGYDYAVSGTVFETDGFSAANEDRDPPGQAVPTENDGARNYSFSFNGGFRPTPDSEIRATFDHTTLFAEFDDTKSRVVFDADETKDKEVTSYSLAGSRDILDGRMENHLTLSGTSTSTRRTSSLAFDGGSDAWYRNIDYRGTFEVADGHLLSFGTGYDQERYARLSGGTTANPTETLDRRTSHRNYFVQTQNRFLDWVSITAGLGFDHFDAIHRDLTDGAWTYRGGVSYDLKETRTILKSSYATGFAAPTLFQLFRFAGTQNLKPENTRLWDAGFEQKVLNDRVEFGATYFRNAVRNQIVFAFSPSRYVNRDQMKSRGLENFVNASLFKAPDRRLDFSLNHTFTLAEDEEGAEIDRVPRHRVNFSLDYAFLDGKANLRLDGEWESDHKDFYPSSSAVVYIGEHWRFDVAGDYQLNDRVKLHARIENILDKAYESAAGYGSAPLGVYGGLTVSF
ncbi:MAG: TonB-dependent receptor [Rhodospirillales bacterium]|nr:TonB-dependent receptor [Rhodospirillales bacterium]